MNSVGFDQHAVDGNAAVPPMSVREQWLHAPKCRLDPEVQQTAALVRVCRACADLFPVDGASISIMSGTGHRETLYGADAVVDRIEALQFSLGEEPCFKAFDTGRPALVPDLVQASGDAWPVVHPEQAVCSEKTLSCSSGLRVQDCE